MPNQNGAYLGRQGLATFIELSDGMYLGIVVDGKPLAMKKYM